MADDLFVWLDALWNKKRPHGTFPVFVAHRFLASDREYALFARVLSNDIRDPELIFGTWQALLPFADKAPRLTYVAPKKRPDITLLIDTMTRVLKIRRVRVEEMVELVEISGRLNDLYAEYGIENPDAEEMDDVNESPRKRGKKSKAPSGLLAMLE